MLVVSIFSSLLNCTTVYHTCLTTRCFFFHQPSLNTVRIQSYEDESYVPMASPSPSVAAIESDGYIPMSPGTFSFLNANCKAEPSVALSPLACQPVDFAPPPIHRHLKPRLRRGKSYDSTDRFTGTKVLCGLGSRSPLTSLSEYLFPGIQSESSAVNVSRIHADIRCTLSSHSEPHGMPPSESRPFRVHIKELQPIQVIVSFLG